MIALSGIAVALWVQAHASDISVGSCDATGRYALVSGGACTYPTFEGPATVSCGPFLIAVEPPRLLEAFPPVNGDEDASFEVGFAGSALAVNSRDGARVRWGENLASSRAFPAPARSLGAGDDGALILVIRTSAGPRLARYVPGGEPQPFGPALTGSEFFVSARFGGSLLAILGERRLLLVDVAATTVVLDSDAEPIVHSPDGRWFLGARTIVTDAGLSERWYELAVPGRETTRARSQLDRVRIVGGASESGTVLLASSRQIEVIDLNPLRVRTLTPFLHPDWDVDKAVLSGDGRYLMVSGGPRFSNGEHTSQVLDVRDLRVVDGGTFPSRRAGDDPPPPRPACEAAARKAAGVVLQQRPDGSLLPVER
ncbi:MAG: hypothetical protein Q8P18_29675 [Pseudomonadota bacterium]|nr:hypothetical protein [Pseudomonadota bacterium]